MCAQSDDAVEGRLYPSDTICYGEIDGLVVVLDLTTQAYLILNEKATLIWKLLLQMEGDLAQTSCALREPSLKSELSSLAKECVERGFLSSSKKVRPRPCQARRPGAKRSFFLGLRAWWSLLSTAYVLRVKGFSRTYREYAQLPLRAAPDPEKLLPAGKFLLVPFCSRRLPAALARLISVSSDNRSSRRALHRWPALPGLHDACLG